MAATLTSDGNGRWSISGELDFVTVPGLWAQLAPQLGSGDWVLDLSPVQRSNSAGLALLLEAEAATRSRGGRMRVEGLPEGLAQLGQMSGLRELLAKMSA